MHPNLLDILSNKELPISNEQLVDYLTGKLTDEENNSVERSMASSGIDSDAMEGLQMLGSKEKIVQYQLEINRKLKESLQQKKPARRKIKAMQLPYLMMLTGALLALILLVWLVIHFMQAGG